MLFNGGRQALPLVLRGLGCRYYRAMIDLIATSAFGLEAVVRQELAELGYSATIVGPGRIQFAGGFAALATANVWLRTADRVGVVVQRFAAADFDALFETTRALPWEHWIPPDGAFPVVGRSRRSQLHSVPAVQRSVKRAVVDRLRQAHGVTVLPESGPRYSIEVAFLDDQATVAIDTTGPGLHKRGYRTRTGPAPLKETLAAALVRLSSWHPERPLIDPFCGTGTIPIEAALMGRNIAPGLLRRFAAEAWPQIAAEVWESVRAAARARSSASLPVRIVATDSDPESLKLARYHARRAGVFDDIHFQERSFEQLTSKQRYGCVITNPPYGLRLGEQHQAEALHRSMPEVLRALPTWSHFILTAQPDFERLIQKQADRRRKLYNGRIVCTYYQFHGPRPGVPDRPAPAVEHPEGDLPAAAPPRSHQVFGGLTAKAHQQAELFRARLRKRARHLRRWPTRRAIYCFRLYERDIPEIPLVVDRYEDHLHLTEYERPHDRDLGQHADWLDLMKRTAAETLDIDLEHVFLKRKLRQRGTTQHEKAADRRHEIAVREGGLRFWVNLSDYVDTGLFLDHRVTRGLVRDAASGQRVLNLFGYTGAFSAYAADGGALAVTTVDWSPVYLEWARRNFELNNLRGPQYHFVQQDARAYLRRLPPEERFDLVIVDPPTFSNSKRTDEDWEIQRDHAALLSTVLGHMPAGACLYFSTNFRRFKLDSERIPAAAIEEISERTVPEDFRNRRIHRCFVIRR